jgi:hypothetical protein
LVTNVDWFVKSYNEYFDFLYKKIAGEKLNIKIDNKKISFENNFGKPLRAILYIEKSSPDKVGEICLEKELSINEEEINLPDNCLDNKLRLFIIDNSGKLIASDYVFN